MWYLVTQDGRRIALPRLPADIGSDANAHVQLLDPSVAPLHARLLPGAATGLRLEVRAGALVELDGWALTEADLRAGDELLVGAVRLRLEHEPMRGGWPPEATAGPRRPLDPPTSGPLSAPQTQRPSQPPSQPRSSPGVGRRSGSSGLIVSETGARRGLLHADLSQLSFGTRCILGLVLLLVAAAIVWAIQALIVGWA